MSDDSTSQDAPPTKSKGSATANGNGTSSGFSAGPAGHGLRRSRTSVDDVSSSRHRTGTPTGRFADATFDLPPQPPRRSSNFSEYSFNEARDLLNPHGRSREPIDTSSPESSSLAGLSLAFALLPALSGVLFTNGHAVVTDIMLLGLAGIFLHWSVTQPWIWYHAAQQVRVQQEDDSDIAVDDESEYETADGELSNSTVLEDVPEEGNSADRPASAGQDKIITPQQQSAVTELYMHEALALVSCFALPLVSAYLLHAIRSQLSRPSEGLVSNYNLTIFLLVAELRAMSHMIKLVQARTLYLQRIVHENPYAMDSTSGSQVAELISRVQALEGRAALGGSEHIDNKQSNISKQQAETTIAQDVRAAIQPELDALNRAMRRYEKRSTLLLHQTDARFGATEARLDDAIALAAAAVKNSAANSSSLVMRVLDSILAIILFPFNVMAQIMAFPLRPFTVFFQKRGGKQSSSTHANGRPRRSGKVSVPSRYGGDRMPARLPKR